MSSLTLLKKIGKDLASDIYPVVHDGGIVEPGQSCCREEEPGEKGNFYESERTRRSAAGSREWAPGRTWSSGGSAALESGSTCSTTSLVRDYQLSDNTVADLEGVTGAYPQVQLRFTPDLVWLLISVTPIRGLQDAALLVTAYPLDNRYNVMTWAWWGPGLFWIGPRHTNYPDGSICSYEISDGTWNRQKALTSLLDLHVVWVVRHIFMRRLGYWPGHQVFHTSYERLTEHRLGELCGGCNSGLRYEDCCQKFDKKTDGVKCVVISVIKLPTGIERKPPKSIQDFVYGQCRVPPSISELSPYNQRIDRFPVPYVGCC